jgi:hypothetical protein
MNRVPSAQVIGTVGLMGWQLNFHKRGQDASAKCNMVQTGKTADVVYAAVYEMRASEKNLLDFIEGLNKGYRLAKLDITELGTAFFYQAEDDYIDDGLLPFDWYKELVIAGSRYHAFPDAYLMQINRVAAMPDNDAARHKHNMAILNMS